MRPTLVIFAFLVSLFAAHLTLVSSATCSLVGTWRNLTVESETSPAYNSSVSALTSVTFGGGSGGGSFSSSVALNVSISAAGTNIKCSEQVQLGGTYATSGQTFTLHESQCQIQGTCGNYIPNLNCNEIMANSSTPLQYSISTDCNTLTFGGEHGTQVVFTRVQ